MKTGLTIEFELRPAKWGSQNVLVHRVEDRQCALVETDEGKLVCVDPMQLRFVDKKHSEYLWPEDVSG